MKSKIERPRIPLPQPFKNIIGGKLGWLKVGALALAVTSSVLVQNCWACSDIVQPPRTDGFYNGCGTDTHCDYNGNDTLMRDAIPVACIRYWAAPNQQFDQSGRPPQPDGAALCITINPVVADFLGGKWDATLDALMTQAIPGDMLSIYHELRFPKKDPSGYTILASDAKAVQNYAMNYKKNHHPTSNLKIGAIEYAGSDANNDGKWSENAAFMATGLDFYGIDMYYTDIPNPIPVLNYWQKQVITNGYGANGATISICECNCKPADQSQRPAYFQTIAGWIHGQTNQGTRCFLTYWNSTGSESGPWDPTDWRTVSELDYIGHTCFANGIDLPAARSSPVCAANSDGRLEIFVVGSDGVLYHKYQPSPGNDNWTGWTALSAASFSIFARPTVVLDRNGCLNLFAVAQGNPVVAQNNLIYVIKEGTSGSSTSWGVWNPVGTGVSEFSPSTTKIAAGLDANGTLQVMAIDYDGHWMECANTYSGGAYHGWANAWTNLGGNWWPGSYIALGMNPDGSLSGLALDPSGNLHEKQENGANGAWSISNNLSHPASAPFLPDASIGLVNNHTGALELAIVCPGDNNLYHLWKNTGSSTSWTTSWASLGSTTGGFKGVYQVPCMTRMANGFMNIYMISGSNNEMYYNAYLNGVWSGWMNVRFELFNQGAYIAAAVNSSDQTVSVFSITNNATPNCVMETRQTAPNDNTTYENWFSIDDGSLGLQ